MTTVDPVKSREFAKDVVQRLRECGYEAVWAGGCVRDQLLGRQPKDYDVATSAHPDQVRNVFGKRRTLAIGAAFGVITVLGPKEAGQIEIATFRRDATYSDGRHPDSVAFSDAREDALRRDFTVNGLFFDPITEEVIDYVGGQADLQQGLIRAIRDPDERFDEDKLRMLRAVRFATTLGFEIDPATCEAVRRHATELVVVSAERVSEELRRILCHDSRRRGAELLQDAGLLSTILPELNEQSDAWHNSLRCLEVVGPPTPSVAFAILLRPLHIADPRRDKLEATCRGWKLSNEEITGTIACLEQEATIRSAQTVDWPVLQRLLIAPRIGEVLQYAKAVALVVDGTVDQIDYCYEKLAAPREQLDPPPLIDGEALKQAGIPPGPIYKKILTRIRDAQLDQVIHSPDEAIAMAMALAAQDRS